MPIDKIPPHDDDLERATLGSLMQDREAIEGVTRQHLERGDFYSRANQNIFEAILSLDGKGVPPDIRTVVQELKQLGKLEESGGAAYVSSLTTVIPSGAQIDFYAEAVRGYSLRRALLKTASNIAAQAYDESSDTDQILQEIQTQIFELSDERKTVSFRKIDAVVQDAISYIETVIKSKNPITGIPTGFDYLDQLTTGFQPADFVVIGARPGVGKTTLALNMAASISVRQKIPTAFFSLEQPDIQLAQRLIASEAMVELSSIRNGRLNPAQLQKILNAAGKIYEAPLYFVDMPNMKLSELRTQARKLRTQLDVKIIFIDYLGLINHGNNNLPLNQQITEISRSLKNLARELKIPLVVLSQLNRDAANETPTLANLRDSGSIEQDADLVMFLYKEFKRSKKNQEDDANPQPTDIIPVTLNVAKQRNGPVGPMTLALHAKYTRFLPVAKDYFSA
ncbi:MAG: replicative DNA helicase [Treponema sp.]|nr:replicative DNA helicase [Treponema sp.]